VHALLLNKSRGRSTIITRERQRNKHGFITHPSNMDRSTSEEKNSPSPAVRETSTSEARHDATTEVDLDTQRTQSIPGEVDLRASHQLERGLKSRHIQFLALGGAIGTALFVGSGGILSTVGPAPLFMAYLSMMFVVWTVMNDLAEMVTFLPLRGISIPYFVAHFVEPSLAFADGWNYWYAYAMLVAAEVTAGAIVLQYWTEAVPVACGLLLCVE